MHSVIPPKLKAIVLLRDRVSRVKSSQTAILHVIKDDLQNYMKV